MEDEIKDPLDVMRPFFIESKVAAFAYHYEPSSEAGPDVVTFADSDLRKYFNAYPKATGDPLTLYVQALSQLGFRMTHDWALSQPVIYAREKQS